MCSKEDKKKEENKRSWISTTEFFANTCLKNKKNASLLPKKSIFFKLAFDFKFLTKNYDIICFIYLNVMSKI